MRTSRTQSSIGHVVLVIAGLVALAPLVGVLLMSVGSPQDVGGSVTLGSPHFSNFQVVWDQADIPKALGTSLLISSVATLLAVVLSIPAGYAFASFRFPLRGLLFVIVLAGLMLPNESLIIPLFYDFRSFGLEDSLSGVILVETALTLAFGSFWMRSFFLTAPKGIVDAARMDGANTFVILVRVLMPMAVPQVLALAVLTFVWTWNDLLVPLVLLSGGQHITAPMTLAVFQGQHATNYAYLSAAALMTALPVILVYAVLQRSFVRGVMAGAIRE
ncbi:MAG: raffinose/stachyose/melibiose transport system permease protein [Pseudonocardiales bacterium]|jgi:raffinose/stachyose/melibiose transport system permease protein|nr:raffinose/stachyose/melibiose transport system permease protein [Pseudonocardiales bacterium]